MHQVFLSSINRNEKKKWKFFQGVAVSVLLHGCTTLILWKRKPKKTDRIYARMLRVVLKESWKQHSKTATVQPLASHLKNIQVRRTGRVKNCWKCRDELLSEILRWASIPVLDGLQRHTFFSSICGHWMLPRGLVKNDG